MGYCERSQAGRVGCKELANAKQCTWEAEPNLPSFSPSTFLPFNERSFAYDARACPAAAALRSGCPSHAGSPPAPPANLHVGPRGRHPGGAGARIALRGFPNFSRRVASNRGGEGECRKRWFFRTTGKLQTSISDAKMPVLCLENGSRHRHSRMSPVLSRLDPSRGCGGRVMPGRGS
jgi:hypothetical protein